MVQALAVPRPREWTAKANACLRCVPGGPAQTGLSKERIFESSFVMATGRRINPKGNHSKQKATPDTTETGHPENTLRNPETPDSRAKKANGAKKANQPRPTQTPEERKEHERARSQTPERKEYQRQHRRKQNQIAQETGKCKDCSDPAIPGQTRCQECAKKHRAYREKAMKNLQARERERVRQKQYRERSKGAEYAD